MKNKCTLERFLSDVKDHELTMKHNDGIYRNLRLCPADSWTYGYDITTWLGYLAISGDMGCFVFSRTDDMFRFFRSGIQEDGSIEVNVGYWHEKLKSVSRFGGDKEYDEDLFKEIIWDYFENWYEDIDVSDVKALEAKEKTRKEIEEMFKYNDIDTENRAYDVASNFESHDGNTFVDLWEHDFKEYTHHFVWCLYAIVYAIKLYDDLFRDVAKMVDNKLEVEN